VRYPLEKVRVRLPHEHAIINDVCTSTNPLIRERCSVNGNRWSSVLRQQQLAGPAADWASYWSKWRSLIHAIEQDLSCIASDAIVRPPDVYQTPSILVLCCFYRPAAAAHQTYTRGSACRSAINSFRQFRPSVL